MHDVRVFLKTRYYVATSADDPVWIVADSNGKATDKL